MLVSLLMSVAIPQAFEDQALLFAASYVAIQVGRHTFLSFVAAAPGTPERERAVWILIYFWLSGLFWIAGALVEGPLRVLLCILAIAVEYGGGLTLFRLPGLRRLEGANWSVGTEHFTERFGLLIILALGESIVLTGATTSCLDLAPARIAAFVLAFLATAAIWWLYFASVTAVARLGEHALEHAENPVMLARDAYTFLHVLFVAGIILTAVGDELVIAHPTDILPPSEVAAVAAGPAVYLLAHALFRYRLTGTLGTWKILGTLACVALGVVGLFVPALVLAGLLIAVLVAVIGSSYVASPAR